MVDILAVVELIIGLVIGFSGKNIYKTSPQLGGFMIGGLLTTILVITFVAASPVWIPVAAFIGGGLVGALIAGPLYMIIVVITSSLFGGLVGVIAGFFLTQQGITRMVVEGIFNFSTDITPVQLMMMLVFAVAFGAASLRFDEFMTMASTGFLGAFILTTGAARLFTPMTALFTDSIFLVFFWAGVGTAGTIFQNQTERE